jgi:3-hydroxyisobutyrate dehydrogenase
MAANLVRGGFEVLAYDQSSEAASAITDEGGHAAGSLADIAACDAAVVMVNTDLQAREVVVALLDARPQPSFSILSMSTILPSSAREIGERAASAGSSIGRDRSSRPWGTWSGMSATSARDWPSNSSTT